MDKGLIFVRAHCVRFQCYRALLSEGEEDRFYEQFKMPCRLLRQRKTFWPPPEGRRTGGMRTSRKVVAICFEGG